MKNFLFLILSIFVTSCIYITGPIKATIRLHNNSSYYVLVRDWHVPSYTLISPGETKSLHEAYGPIIIYIPYNNRALLYAIDGIPHMQYMVLQPDGLIAFDKSKYSTEEIQKPTVGGGSEYSWDHKFVPIRYIGGVFSNDSLRKLPQDYQVFYMYIGHSKESFKLCAYPYLPGKSNIPSQSTLDKFTQQQTATISDIYDDIDEIDSSVRSRMLKNQPEWIIYNKKSAR